MPAPAPTTYNGRVLAFLETCTEPMTTGQIAKGLDMDRNRVVTACSELGLMNRIYRTPSDRGMLYSALAKYPELPHEGATPGLYLAPYLGLKVQHDPEQPAGSLRHRGEAAPDSLAA